MSVIKYLGLEISVATPEKADGYVSYAELNESGKVVIKKKHLSVDSNDGTFLKATTDKVIDKDMFKNLAACLFTRFEESDFVDGQHIFSIRFFNRTHKNIPSLTMSKFEQGEGNDFIVESSLLHVNRAQYTKQPKEKQNSKPQTNDERGKQHHQPHQQKKQHHKPAYQSPANQEPKTGIPDATGEPATEDQLQQLVDRHANGNV